MAERRLLPDPRLLPLLAALMLGLLLAELDQSMVAAALPRMVADLDGLGGLVWVTTGFVLAATAVLPVCGALGDRYGRRPVLMAALLLILAGSALAAVAPTMPVLIAARVVQGLGAGGMLVLVQASVADVLPARDRTPVLSVIGAVFAVAALVGPLLGGWLAQGPGWRWIFWLNLPVGAAALAAAWWLLPRRDPRPTSTHLGRRPALRPADLVPLRLLGRRTVALVVAGGLLLGAATFGLFGYLPTYLQLALGLSPVGSGLWMLTLMAGLGAGTLTSALVVSRTGVHRPLPVVGAGLAALALGVLGAFPTDPAPAPAVVGGCLALLGLGVGAAWEVLVVMAQNSVDADQVGAVTALNGFGREVGVLIGAAAAGVAVTARLSAGIAPTAAFVPVFVGSAAAALAAAAVLLPIRRRPLATAAPVTTENVDLVGHR